MKDNIMRKLSYSWKTRENDIVFRFIRADKKFMSSLQLLRNGTSNSSPDDWIEMSEDSFRTYLTQLCNDIFEIY